MGPSFLLISFTSAFTSAVERASSFATVAFFSPFSFFTSTSVAITFAPSATNASAIARPIPCPAAVTSATLPLSLPAKRSSHECSKLLYQMHGAAVTHVFGPLIDVTVAGVPRDVSRERLAGIEGHPDEAERLRARFRELQHHVADAAALRRRRCGDAPDQEIVCARLQDQHAAERTLMLRQIDLVLGEHLLVVGL